MLLRALALLSVTGCAQLAGIDDTSRSRDAAPLADAAPDAPPIDALPCVGGDARVTDPGTGACYMLFTTPATRNEARATCIALGGGTLLASSQSAAENQLIATLIGATDAFLGGNDETTEGTFVWDDGTSVVLTSWNTGEPNNALGMFEEDCIVMLGTVPGKWDDRPCAPPPVATGAYAFVCERD